MINMTHTKEEDFKISSDMAVTACQLSEHRHTDYMDEDKSYYTAAVVIHLHNELVGVRFMVDAWLPTDYENVQDLEFFVNYEGGNLYTCIEFYKNMEREREAIATLEKWGFWGDSGHHKVSLIPSEESMSSDLLVAISRQISDPSLNSTTEYINRWVYHQLSSRAVMHKKKVAAQ
ncbi:MAG: hypothetical protein ACTIJH_05910 [Moraxellaceae bacterium]